MWFESAIENERLIEYDIENELEIKRLIEYEKEYKIENPIKMKYVIWF